MKKALIFISLIVCIVLVSAPAFGNDFNKSAGQTVYVAFAHNCQWSSSGFPSGITPASECTSSANSRLIIRNVDSDDYITVTEMNFYRPDGTLFGDYLDAIDGPFDLAPLASRTFAIHPTFPYWSNDVRPSFIVKWTADRAVHPPSIGSAIVIINHSPSGSGTPFIIEGLTTIQGRVLNNQPKAK